MKNANTYIWSLLSNKIAQYYSCVKMFKLVSTATLIYNHSAFDKKITL